MNNVYANQKVAWLLLLLDDNLDVYCIKMLVFWYSNQLARVRWWNSISSSFYVSNGTKQRGGIVTILIFVLYSWFNFCHVYFFYVCVFVFLCVVCCVCQWSLVDWFSNKWNGISCSSLTTNNFLLLGNRSKMNCFDLQPIITLLTVQAMHSIGGWFLQKLTMYTRDGTWHRCSCRTTWFMTSHLSSLLSYLYCSAQVRTHFFTRSSLL